MSKMLVGSICLTDLMDFAKKAHPAYSRGKNGKAYVNIVLWENEPDKYGNTISIQLNSVKDKREEEGKVYIGNAKPLTPKNDSDNENAEDGDGLPF